jgi:RNA polymerase-binding transcription factor DksA
MLSPERIERLRRYLLEEETNLRQQIHNLGLTSQEAAITASNHMAEDATAAFDQAAAVSLRRGHQAALAEVERALARMTAGTYGVCERCRAPIDFARLKALPHATLCMTCQRAAEL